MKIKIYKTLAIILSIALVIAIGLLILKEINSNIREQKNKEVVNEFVNNLNVESVENNSSNEEPEEVTLKGYKVIGVISIPKINIKYPILDVEKYNPEETKKPLKISIVKYWGGNVNEYGNLSLAGHHYLNGTMFGNTSKLENGDIIELTDTNGNKVQYAVYSKFATDPNDVTILETKDKTIREVTLITCTNGNKQRLIVKAKEI